MIKRINVKDDLPDSDILVSVYSERDDKYGYARLVSKKKYGETIQEWSFDEKQDIEYSIISHWWPIPELPADE